MSKSSFRKATRVEVCERGDGALAGEGKIVTC